MKKRLVAGIFLLGCGASVSRADTFSSWLSQEQTTAVQRLQMNISRAGASPGSVVASPSTSTPNYYYHWTRDAAMTMELMVSLYQSSSGSTQSQYKNSILQYAQFSRQNQVNDSDNAEPKFYVNGSPYTAPWCRPQTDAPASRAITLTQFAQLLLNAGDSQDVSTLLYDSKLPTSSVIKSDLEYVANNWQNPTCDLWEEVTGTHFYTRILQRRALLDGAALATRLNDPNAATFYTQQANAIAATLSSFWNGHQIVPTINQTAGSTAKTSGLDAAVILGVLHADRGDGFFAMTNPQVEATATALINVFKSLYPINKTGQPGVAIGRYPEDVYDGNQDLGGNPWVLITAAFARYSYLAAIELRAQGNTMAANLYFNQGDAFLQCVQTHANADGSLSEQIDRNTGYMASAVDLSWSYVEVVEAMNARASAAQTLKKH